jgi:hypothetical protein
MIAQFWSSHTSCSQPCFLGAVCSVQGVHTQNKDVVCSQIGGYNSCKGLQFSKQYAVRARAHVSRECAPTRTSG